MIRFRNGYRYQLLAAGDRWQPCSALLLSAAAQQCADKYCGSSDQAPRSAKRNPRQLLGCDEHRLGVFGIQGATIGRGDGCTEQPEPGQVGDDVIWHV
jgi:hypothetical protein